MIYIENVFVPNDVLRIRNPTSVPLSACVWITPVVNSLKGTRIQAMTEALDYVTEMWPEWDFWLLATHRAVQSNNSITRRNGLWKSLKARGLAVPCGASIAETVMISETGIRVFSAVSFDRTEIPIIAEIGNCEDATVLVGPRVVARQMATRLTHDGWHRTGWEPPSTVLEALVAEEAAVIALSGEFDDSEVAAAIVGRDRVIGEGADSGCQEANS